MNYFALTPGFSIFVAARVRSMERWVTLLLRRLADSEGEGGEFVNCYGEMGEWLKPAVC
jgi:hypothetical protein